MKQTPFRRIAHKPMARISLLGSARKPQVKRTYNGMIIWKVVEADRQCKSEAVARAHERCEMCGKAGALDPSHFVGRNRMATRFARQNIDALCRPCHEAMEGKTNPGQEYYEWKKAKMGEEALKRLIGLSRQIVSTNAAIIDLMRRRGAL